MTIPKLRQFFGASPQADQVPEGTFFSALGKIGFDPDNKPDLMQALDTEHKNKRVSLSMLQKFYETQFPPRQATASAKDIHRSIEAFHP